MRERPGRHVSAGHFEHVALIWDSAMVPARKTFTYRELRDQVAQVAGALAGCLSLTPFVR